MYNDFNFMRICILYDYEFDPEQFLHDYEWEIVDVQRPVMDVLRPLSKKNNFDVYLNLCDGAADEDYPGRDVVLALERLNLPFTGAESSFYDPTREQMQAVAEAKRIGFARGFQAKSVKDLEQHMNGLRYPLMVKHPNSYGSEGMTRKSRVDSPAGLRTQVNRLCRKFGSARVEEFIEGREFTVLVVDNPDDLSEPFVYPPAELIFPDGEEFLHSDVKWELWVYMKPVTDPILASRLQDISRRLYLGLNGSGYARCDIRMNARGELFILEINPNCGILYEPELLGPADTVMDYDPDGHAGFLDRIFRAAIARQKLRAGTVL
jgi:D-alanine-D-alanine ligase